MKSIFKTRHKLTQYNAWSNKCWLLLFSSSFYSLVPTASLSHFYWKPGSTDTTFHFVFCHLRPRLYTWTVTEPTWGMAHIRFSRHPLHVPCLVHGVHWHAWTNKYFPVTFFLKLVPALIYIWLKIAPCFCLPHPWSLCSEDRACHTNWFFTTEHMQKRPNWWWHFSSQQLLKSGRIFFSIIFMFNETFNPPP